MMSMKVHCTRCGRAVRIEGRDMEDIFERFEDTGWTDFLGRNLCPPCQDRIAEETTQTKQITDCHI